jgi:hypothetical protein
VCALPRIVCMCNCVMKTQSCRAPGRGSAKKIGVWIDLWIGFISGFSRRLMTTRERKKI